MMIGARSRRCHAEMFAENIELASRRENDVATRTLRHSQPQRPVQHPPCCGLVSPT